jgi:hypothetical protein
MLAVLMWRRCISNALCHSYVKSESPYLLKRPLGETLAVALIQVSGYQSSSFGLVY